MSRLGLTRIRRDFDLSTQIILRLQRDLALRRSVKNRMQSCRRSPIRVRLYRITNEVIQRRKRGVESRVVIENCPRAVDVSRRTEFRGNAR